MSIEAKFICDVCKESTPSWEVSGSRGDAHLPIGWHRISLDCIRAYHCHSKCLPSALRLVASDIEEAEKAAYPSESR